MSSTRTLIGDGSSGASPNTHVPIIVCGDAVRSYPAGSGSAPGGRVPEPSAESASRRVRRRV
jgi:hypothetical protein